MEIADLILVNKADGDLKPAASRTVADYAGALRLLRKRAQDPEGYPKALPVSALAEEGLTGAWADMLHLAEWRRAEGHWAKRRAAQATHWFEEEVRSGLLAQLTDNTQARSQMAALAGQVADGQQSPDAAAALMLAYLRGESLDSPPQRA